MSAAVSLDTSGRAHLSVLSNSAIACYRRCPREYSFRYVAMRRPRRSSEALRFGTFFHLGLEHWWATPGEPADKLEAALVMMRARAASNEDDSDPFELVKAEELMLGYTARWGDAGYDTVGVEVPFEVPLVNPDTGAASKTYRLGGKIDVIARKDGELEIIEHKTTSDDITGGSDYWRNVSATDAQVSTYISGAKAAGHNVVRCTYDVVRKVGLRPKRATPEEARRYTKAGKLDARQRLDDETPEEFRARVRADIAEDPSKYYARGPIVRLEADEREHAGDVWQTAWFMREAENAKRFPRSPGSCRRFNRFCDYFDVCSGVANINDDSRFRTASAPHEELSEV